MAVKIFFCYAHEDEVLLNMLKTHLRPLQREALIDVWYDRDIGAGTEWEQEISNHLNEAQIILLLVSPDFIASDYCHSVEMKRAIERHERGEARVIPIILRRSYWQGVLGNLQALPTDARPVKSWPDLDEGFYNVFEGIRKIVVDEYENRIKNAISAREFQTELEYAIEGSNEVNAETLPRGKRLKLSFHINNNLSFAFSIWLGAHLRLEDHYYYNIEEDAEVLLQPGNGVYTRFLTIKKNWPTGDYYLEIAVHYGIRSHPEKSLMLDDVSSYPLLLRIT